VITKARAELTNDEDDADVGVLLENTLDLGNVGLVLVLAIVVEGVFSVGGSGSAVTLRKIVDNELTGIVGTSLVSLADISKGVLHETDVLKGVPENISKGFHMECISETYIHWKEGTSATLAAAVAMAPLSLGIARVLTSER
jgi:hypothetical protein